MKKEKEKMDAQYRKGYVDGYRKAMEDITENGITREAQTTDDALLETLPLAKRTIACLHRSDIYRIGELLALDRYQIWALSGIGAGSRREIAKALYERGVLSTDWLIYL